MNIAVPSDLIVSSGVIAFALLWAYSGRLSEESAVRQTVEKIVTLPAPFWIVVAVAAFVIPVFDYWITGRSHGNALGGFLPWNDAGGYFYCAEKFLLGINDVAECSRRPFYPVFFADLLWLTGNHMQLALLLQAIIVGCAVVILCWTTIHRLTMPGAAAAYATLYLFAAQYCSALMMTENAGLLFGTLGLALL